MSDNNKKEEKVENSVKLKSIKSLYAFHVQDGSVERTFALLKPSRKVRQDGDLFYSSQLSRFISAGVLPRALFEKIIKNNGGAISEPDKEEYSELYLKLVELNAQLANLSADSVEDKPGSKEKIEKVQAEMVEVRREMQSLESNQASIYENTAEAKARNQSVLWWFFKLAVEVVTSSGEEKASNLIDQGLTYEKQLDFFDSILEGDNEFFKNVASRLNYLSTVWFLGAASVEDDFLYFDKEYLAKGQEEIEVQLEKEEGKADEEKPSEVVTEEPLAEPLPENPS